MEYAGNEITKAIEVIVKPGSTGEFLVTGTATSAENGFITSVDILILVSETPKEVRAASMAVAESFHPLSLRAIWGLALRQK